MTQAHSQSDIAIDLAFAMIASSIAPVLLLDDHFRVMAASASFCGVFQIDPASVPGRSIFGLGEGEWDEPRLRSLLTTTISTGVSIDRYEMDIQSKGEGTRRLVVNAQKLDYVDTANIRLLVTMDDVTDLRKAGKLHDDLLRDKANLIREIQHRIANSLQIIASLIMQSARKVQSDGTRGHLHDAHDRVISIAAVQRHLAESDGETVKLRSYFTQLAQGLGASMIADPHALSIEVQTDESVVDGEASVSLGLIVTELVINALKHAFPNERGGKIQITYWSHGPDWTLSVKDDGIGMPSPAGKAQPGLGTSIIEALARQLDARIDLVEAHPGTTISVIHTHVAASDGHGNVLQFHKSV